jgi:hypothetical protein
MSDELLSMTQAGWDVQDTNNAGALRSAGNDDGAAENKQVPQRTNKGVRGTEVETAMMLREKAKQTKRIQ